VSEFTGERVIPREVNDDLWAEHFARYAFARTFAPQKRALDIGCGAGYGVAELALAARQAVGIDLACEAIAYAQAHYRKSTNAAFIQASATALPFANESFDLITAFEVIEHLIDWRGLLEEAKRVLSATGLLLISTPNKHYYAESRAEHGPNPFHVHEFDFAEFQAALREFFPHTSVLLQNWSASIVFSPADHALASIDARVDAAPAEPRDAHFFLGMCSLQPRPEPGSFLYLPRAANVLREREHHIRLLQRDLEAMTAERNTLIDLHDQQTRELEERNHWALQLEHDWKATLDRVAQLQDELEAEQARGAEVAAAYAHKVADLEDENRQKTEWALETERHLSADLAVSRNELARAVRLLDAAEATVVERTLWAQRVQASLDTLEAQLRMIRQSRWVRLGRAVRLGPRVEG
jgi:ubiquinone/menaquinone biosynthesis C-methylase UbiE